MAKMLRVSGVITQVTAELFCRDLQALNGQAVDVRINSEGGDVDAGLKMYDALSSYPGKTTAIVESLAASMASVVILACDKVMIHSQAEIMIHPPEALLRERLTADNLQLAADYVRGVENKLLKIYTDATGKTSEEIKALWANEPYFDAKASLALGFVDGIVESPEEAPEAAACIKLRGNEPQNVVRLVARAKGTKGKTQMNEEEMKALRAELGLAADASAEQIMSALKALKKTSSEEPPPDETEEENTEASADEAVAAAVAKLPSVEDQVVILRALANAGGGTREREELMDRIPETMHKVCKGLPIASLRAFAATCGRSTASSKRREQAPTMGNGKANLKEQAKAVAKATGESVDVVFARLSKNVEHAQ
jgi:ATP-dependent protease ClpP protease subunit